MSKTTIDQASSIALPPETLNALGVQVGDELDIEIVGRALVIRSVKETQCSGEFATAFYATLSKTSHRLRRLG